LVVMISPTTPPPHLDHHSYITAHRTGMVVLSFCGICDIRP
jgi:hypothetical protein